MKRITYEPVFTISGYSHPINTNRAKGYGCFVEILRATHTQMTGMLSHHSKVLMLRLDLHVSGFTPTNHVMSMFMKRMKRALAAAYGMRRTGHVWVREVERAVRQHYHVALLLDGHKVQHPSNVIRIAEAIWVSMGQPKPFTPRNAYTQVLRGNPASFDAAFFRLSYFAKCRGKGCRGKSANDYSVSRIRERLPKR